MNNVFNKAFLDKNNYLCSSSHSLLHSLAWVIFFKKITNVLYFSLKVNKWLGIFRRIGRWIRTDRKVVRRECRFKTDRLEFVWTTYLTTTCMFILVGEGVWVEGGMVEGEEGFKENYWLCLLTWGSGNETKIGSLGNTLTSLQVLVVQVSVSTFISWKIQIITNTTRINCMLV